MLNKQKLYEPNNQEHLDELSSALEISQETLSQLMTKAEKVKDFSYSPYSKFRVGCSLLTKKDNIFVGTNVENVSYGVTNCAERTAIYTAVTTGETSFKIYFVTSDMEDFLTPCGACRQAISEFGSCHVVLMNKDRKMQLTSIDELLPTKPSIDHLKK